MLKPKLITSLKNYTYKTLSHDFWAGVHVGVVALPLSIAFGVLSGLSPNEGLLTAIVAGFAASMLGGSRVQITGPTGAAAIVVYGVLHHYGNEGLIVCTVLTGLFMVVLGLTKLGNLIKLMPRPITFAFTCSVAVIILSSQIRDMFGLSIEKVPVSVAEKIEVYWQGFHAWNPYALAVTMATVLLMSLWSRIMPDKLKKIPESFAALMILSIVAFTLKIPVETIGERFGTLVFSPRLINGSFLSFELVKEMIRPAFTIALLGSIVSLMSAVVGDGMTHGRHRSNMELIAQGVANVLSGIMGGIPAQGAVARTAMNVKSGAQTPVAGMVHSLTLFVIVIFFGKYAQWIPMPCLAGVLIVVSFRMIDWYSLLDLVKSPKSDISVFVVTSMLGIFVNLTVAMEVGVVLAIFLFVNRMALVTQTRPFIEDNEESDDFDVPAVSAGIEVYEINGPLFFASSLDFLKTIRHVAQKVKVQILYFQNTSVIDATGLHYLRLIHQECRAGGIHLVLAGLHAQPLKVLKRAGYFELFGRKNIYIKLASALVRAEELIKSKCVNDKAR